MKPLTRFFSQLPTFFAISLCGMFLSAWFAAKRNGAAMLPEEWSGVMIILMLFSSFQNLRNDIRRIRSRFKSRKRKEQAGTASYEAEPCFGTIPHERRFRLPILVSILPTYIFFQAILAFLSHGWSLFHYQTEGNVYLGLTAVSFVIAVLNLVNDHEHTAVLCSAQFATNAPAAPPSLPTAESGDTAIISAAPKWLLPVGRSPWAVAAGYLGLVSFLLLPAPFALLFGILGLLDIRRNPQLCGKGRAWLGVVAGALFTAVVVAGYLGLFSKE